MMKKDKKAVREVEVQTDFGRTQLSGWCAGVQSPLLGHHCD